MVTDNADHNHLCEGVCTAVRNIQTRFFHPPFDCAGHTNGLTWLNHQETRTCRPSHSKKALSPCGRTSLKRTNAHGPPLLRPARGLPVRNASQSPPKFAKRLLVRRVRASRPPCRLMLTRESTTPSGHSVPRTWS